MKKFISIVIMFSMILVFANTACAADMGVQIIGGPEEEETETVSLDDLKLNVDVEIDGWGILKLISFEYIDYFEIADNSGFKIGNFESGEEADYAFLRLDITNTTVKSKDYLSDITVKTVFDDVYEYGGWAYQFNFDKSKNRVVKEDNRFPIEPMYQGHYVFGSTIPNAVVNSKKPLQMIFTIDGNEFTYNIRK